MYGGMKKVEENVFPYTLQRKHNTIFSGLSVK
jgi:hypothetical protein